MDSIVLDCGFQLMLAHRQRHLRSLWLSLASTLWTLQSTQVGALFAENRQIAQLTGVFSPVIVSKSYSGHFANCKTAAWFCLGYVLVSPLESELIFRS